MKKQRWIIAALVLALGGLTLLSCTNKEPVESEHIHEYHLRETSLVGVCSDPGYQLYACECGDSFKSDIPSPHEYETIADVTGAYFKTLCKHCGLVSGITHEQEYFYVLDFEGVKDLTEAGNKPNTQAYRIGGIEGEQIGIVKDGENSVLWSTVGNYYLLDKTNTLKDGKDFVVSMDIRYETFANTAIFSVLGHNRNKDFSYNAGLIFADAEGRMTFVAQGDPEYQEEVYLSQDGYDTITVKGNLSTGLYDIYLNQKLVRKNVPYVKAQSSFDYICIRFFDVRYSNSNVPYVAYADNLKLYAASAPEFIIDESQITFEK